MNAASRLLLGLVLLFLLSILSLSSLAFSFATLLLVILAHITNDDELPPDELFRRCARIPPDEKAWHEFFRRYREPIHLGICKVIGFSGWKHGRYLHEVQQEFHLRLLANNSRAMAAFRGHTEAEARWYLRCIAANVALNVIRREARHQHSPIPEPDTPGSQSQKVPPRDDGVRSDFEKCLQESLRGQNKLRNMLMFKLFALEDLRPAEIAKIAGLGMTAHAIEIQIGRIRDKLKKCLGQK